MIAYRPQERTVCVSAELAGIRRKLDGPPVPAHGDIQDALIHLGEIESGAADALAPDFDLNSDCIGVFRRATTALAQALYRSWRGESVREWLNPCLSALVQAAALTLPERVTTSVPEGYAYYGLFPEMYIDAAQQCWRELRPADAVVIGIRSIGTSLSAVVSASLAAFGCRVRSATVRPRGHPFDRVVRISSELRREWAACESALFAIVDEGPGLSGSSFAAVSNLLRSAGVPDERIVLFPSWDADPDAFVNRSAGDRWRRHRTFVGRFECRSAGTDFSAGKWREALYESDAEYPAVQPQHERRKYLAEPDLMLKFAGLGRYGDEKFAMAGELAEAGFSPCPRSLSDGFLATAFIPGEPLNAAAASRDLLDRIALYLAFRKRRFPAERSLSFDQILGMMDVNAAEARPRVRASVRSRNRGREGAAPGAAVAFDSLRAEFEDRLAIAVDGRMLPHEWVRTSRGFLKADATDHHADHFFPGDADVLWDVAGAGVEFQLGSGQQDYLFERYRACSGDRPSRDLLEFYKAAYLAFRLGYATLAAQATSGGDHERFKTLQRHYARGLREAIDMRDQSCQVPV